MDPSRFDQISRHFSDRRLSRRAAMTQGGAGLAVGAAALTGLGLGVTAAQDATPTAEGVPVLPPDDGDHITHLFVQSFQSGSIAPAATGGTATHTVTLEQGLGQTIYFADRPSREVGVGPTPAFLAGLGFMDDNPPNAALLVETAPGETEIAVVELYNPTYDEASHTATYDIAVLADWRNDIEMGFQEEPTGLADLSASFGASHLFIDGCGNKPIECTTDNGNTSKGGWQQATSFWWSTFQCEPTTPKGAKTTDEIRQYWTQMCNDSFPDCAGDCRSFY